MNALDHGRGIAAATSLLRRTLRQGPRTLKSAPVLFIGLCSVSACSKATPILSQSGEVEAPVATEDPVSSPPDSANPSPPKEEEDDAIISVDADEKEVPCGNGRLDEGEVCDDSNETSGDGCSLSCLLEDGYTCPILGAACELATICGDSRQSGGEDCDDGNTTDGDGCSATCRQEADFACPEPGQPCVSTVACGDGRISGAETCDDGNAQDGDGCDSACTIEPGWACANAGLRCSPICGDAELTGRESCDDGNAEDGDGCSASCQRESGFACETLGMPCAATVCGDNKAEGDEPCDDGDDIHVGDGCSPGCRLEPACEPARYADAANGDAGVPNAGLDGQIIPGVCSSSCGDGLLLAGDAEECDDGNSIAGDGCSAECKVEEGWECQLSSEELPDQLELPVVYRDFIHKPAAGGNLARHPDFQIFEGSDVTPGLAQVLLGGNGKPQYTGICEVGQALDPALCPHNEQSTSLQNFSQWYTDVQGVNIPVADTLNFARQPDNTYVVGGVGMLFPLDAAGWVATNPPEEATSNDHNFGFTTELRTWFEFKGGEFLEFQGDDDVWVFIGGQLVVDIGGLHPSKTASVTLDGPTATGLGLEVGRVYEMALFHAERRTNHSNFKLTIGGFLNSQTSCESVCGDGIVVGEELCDDGDNNGAGYGFCTVECTPGPRCGDGVVSDAEECDDGINLTGYQNVSAPEMGCAPGCVLPPFCGDGRLDSGFGEQCDEGENNTGAYDGCNPDCSLGPRCGDGITNGDELCDDGNTSNSDSCDISCNPITLILQ